MKTLLTGLLMLVSVLCWGAPPTPLMPLRHNFFTTNPAPIVDVVAGSNATVQATLVGANTRRFTVNAVPESTTNFALLNGTNTFYGTILVTTNLIALGTITATNGFILQLKPSFTTNFTCTTNLQVYCANGTNQLITLPNAAYVPGVVYHFTSTNNFGSFTLTNATGGQTIRDNVLLSVTHLGITPVSLISDGSRWLAVSDANSDVKWVDSTMNYAFSTTGPSAPTLTAVTAGSVIQELAFDNGDILYAQSQFNHNVATTNDSFPNFYFEPHVHFTTIGTLDSTHSNVTWRVEWQLANIGGTWTSGTNSVTFGVTANDTHYMAELGHITNNAMPKLSAIFRCRLMRPASVGQDYSNAHDVLLDGFDIHYPVGNQNMIGSTKDDTP